MSIERMPGKNRTKLDEVFKRFRHDPAILRTKPEKSYENQTQLSLIQFKVNLTIRQAFDISQRSRQSRRSVQTNPTIVRIDFNLWNDVKSQATVERPFKRAIKKEIK